MATLIKRQYTLKEGHFQWSSYFLSSQKDGEDHMELFKILGTIALEGQERFQRDMDKSTKEGQKLAKSVGEGLKKAAKVGVTAVTVLGTAAVAVAESTREYRTEMGKLDTAFKMSGHSSEAATSTYKALQSVLGETDTAVEASNHLAKLCSNEQQLQTWTDICTGVFATFGDSLPIEGLTEAANETAKTGVVTGSLADALNWAGVSEDEFNASLAACNSEQERTALITETLNGLYSQTAEEYRKNNAAVIEANAAQEKWNSAMAKVGGIVEPVITKIKSGLADAISTAVDKFTAFTDWINEHQGLVIALGTVFGVLTTALTAFCVVQGVKAAMNAAEAASLGSLIAMKLADAAATMAMLAPYVLVVAAITAVIAIIVLCVQHWDQIKAKVAEVAQNVAEKVEEIRTAIADKLSAAAEAVSSKFEEIKSNISDKINAAKEAVHNAIEAIKGFFNFEWSLPHLKLPHISISGSFSLNPPSVPSFGIEWYKKGGILNDPTIFGLNPFTGNAMVGGEAGAEAIAPIDTLKKYVTDAVHDAGSTALLREIVNILNEFKSGKIPISIVLDIVTELDGATIARKLYKYNLLEQRNHGTSLINA